MGEDVSRTTIAHDEELRSLSWALHFFCYGMTSVSLARQMGMKKKKKLSGHVWFTCVRSNLAYTQ